MLKETRGAIKKDNKYYCEKCGADLSKDNSVHFVAHVDEYRGEYEEVE